MRRSSVVHDPLSSSPPPPPPFEAEEAEVMELSGPDHTHHHHTLSDPHPPPTTATITTTSGMIGGGDVPVSPPAVSSAKAKRKGLGWLTHPHRLMDRMREDWDGPGSCRTTKDWNQGLSDHHTYKEEEDDWETMSSGSSESSESSDEGEEWEEVKVYVELDDVATVQELFAVKTDDFLRFQPRRVRLARQAAKETFSQLTLQVHNLDSEEPFIQIGKKFFVGSWEEAAGSALFFTHDPHLSEPGPGDGELKTPTPPPKSSLLPQPMIPWDPVFGPTQAANPSTHIVGMADKILKTRLFQTGRGRDKSGSKSPASKSSEPFPLFRFKIPKSSTVKDMFFGGYSRPKRRHPKRKNPGLVGTMQSTDDSSSSTHI